MSPASVSLPRLATCMRWALVCWIVTFWRLDFLSLIDDGAHYAQLTREMLSHQSWLVPLLDGAPYIDKPVFFHWIQGVSLRVIGDGELGARLPSALAAVVLLLFTRWFGRRVFGVAVAERAALMLATVPATFVLSRIGYLDMLFTACLFGGVGCLLASALGGAARLQYAGSGLIVCAVMTKGPVAIMLVLGFAGASWLVGGDCRRAMRSLRWKSVAAILVLGSAPWFAWMYWQFGDEFVRRYIVDGHAFYLSPRSSSSSSANAFYLQMFLTAFFPWSLVAAGYAIDTARRWRMGHRPSTVDSLLWLWIVCVLAAFTLARFRVDRYIYPAAPACCLLAARAWGLARAEGGAGFRATRAAIFVLAFIIVGVGVALSARLPSLGFEVSTAAYALPALLCVGGLGMAASMVRHRFRPPLALHVPLVTLVGVYGLVVAFGLPLIEQAKPARQVGNWLRDRSPDEPVAVYGLEGWRTSLRYYSTRTLERLESQDEAREFLERPGPGWVVMRRRAFEALTQAGVSANVAFSLPIVVGTEGRWIRRQVWGRVFVVRRGD